jgi:predicted TIM-barrel fold metal-dependent hydrolase
MDIPRIISVDDHVVEPGHVWTNRLTGPFRDAAPRVVRVQGRVGRKPRTFVFREGQGEQWADCWSFEGELYPIVEGLVASGRKKEDLHNGPMLFDDMLPGCYDQGARLADMDANHTEASICFPTFPRFCGQTFLEAHDKDLALACVQAYNDWMIDEWCAGVGYGRLIPLTLIPLWDVQLAVDEVNRCAAKGSHAICFSEAPPSLDLPSIHSGYWDPLWAACQDTETVVNMHIGSSSTFPSTARDAPMITSIALMHEGSTRALVDWLCSGVMVRFPKLRISLSEGQIGWIPFVLERIDYGLRGHGAYAGWPYPEPPSTYFHGRVFGCVVDDVFGLRNRDAIGMDQIMFEIDYPHGDSSWPDTLQRLKELIHEASLTDEEIYKLVRGNAIAGYGLHRFGITA